MSELGPSAPGALTGVPPPMLPLAISEASITQGTAEPLEGELAGSEEEEDYEHPSMYPPPQERNRDLVTGNGPVPTTQVTIGDSIGGEINPPNGL